MRNLPLRERITRLFDNVLWCYVSMRHILLNEDRVQMQHRVHCASLQRTYSSYGYSLLTGKALQDAFFFWARAYALRECKIRVTRHKSQMLQVSHVHKGHGHVHDYDCMSRGSVRDSVTKKNNVNYRQHDDRSYSLMRLLVRRAVN